jgi:hypothetical protein
MKYDDFDDEVEEYVVDAETDRVPNLFMQCKKVIDVRGKSSISFVDGSVVFVPIDTVRQFMKIYSNAKPFEREVMQYISIQNYESMQNVISGKKQEKIEPKFNIVRGLSATKC